MELILFVISALPVFLLAKSIYNQDRNKEPIKLLIKLFIAGIMSVFLVLIFSLVLGIIFPVLSAEYETLNKIELIAYVFIGVALVEEVSKWIMTYFISYNDMDFEEVYDMVIYAVFVALGFAFFENLLYVYDGGISTGIVRAILAVPGHASDGVFMGYYLGLAKYYSVMNDNSKKRKYLLLSVLVPTLLHGIYDYCLLVEDYFFLGVFFVFVAMVFRTSINKVKKVSSSNRKFRFKNKFCPNCGRKVDSVYCPECGFKNE